MEDQVFDALKNIMILLSLSWDLISLLTSKLCGLGFPEPSISFLRNALRMFLGASVLLFGDRLLRFDRFCAKVFFCRLVAGILSNSGRLVG